MDPALEEKVNKFPISPGVYLIKDAVGRVIYVGKARSLRQRVRSYLSKTGRSAPRLQALQSHMKDIDIIVTGTEVEALILESNLIKEHRPRYNVNLKDDKDYPFLRLTAELYPRLEYLRLSQRYGRRGRNTPVEDRARYFGPYTDAKAVKGTMRLLGRLFPLRRCKQVLDGTPVSTRPCLNYQIKRCLAPCRGSEKVTPAEYAQVVEQVVLFLEGHQLEVARRIKRQMEQAARNLQYEKAARLRDQLLAMQKVIEQRQVVSAVNQALDRDVLALVEKEDEKAVHMFKIREGILLGQEHFPLTGTAEVTDEEIMAAFIKNYYSRGITPPAEIIVSVKPDDKDLIQCWLQEQLGSRVRVMVPRRGFRKQLLEMAYHNGLLQLAEAREKAEIRERFPLRELARLVGLKEMPVRIEGYDISHLQGSEAVASMVVFEQGRALKDGYRHFFLRETPAGDDYAAFREVLKRRARKNDWPDPDLILIDGGRGQLQAALSALQESRMAGVYAIALAKDPEQIFLPGEQAPLILPAHSTLLQLLQRIRDEAHRFALDYHRRLRKRSATSSILESVSGIGPKRRAALLKHFGSVEKVCRASEQELAAVPGLSKTLARNLYRQLQLLKGEL